MGGVGDEMGGHGGLILYTAKIVHFWEYHILLKVFFCGKSYFLQSATVGDDGARWCCRFLRRNNKSALFALLLLQIIVFQPNALKFKRCKVLFCVAFSSTKTTKTTESNKIYKKLFH